jgi:uncharacterized membrane protein YjfL (UPF0719 family)
MVSLVALSLLGFTIGFTLSLRSLAPEQKDLLRIMASATMQAVQILKIAYVEGFFLPADL